MLARLEWASDQLYYFRNVGENKSEGRISARMPGRSSVTSLRRPQANGRIGKGLGAMLFSWTSRGHELWRTPQRESLKPESALAGFRNI